MSNDRSSAAANNGRASEIPSSLLRAALESAGEAVIVTDLDGQIIFVNPAFERITGWKPSEALGQNPRILQSGEEPGVLYTDLWRTISTGKTWSGSFRNRRKDGSLYRVEQTIAPVRDESHHIIGYVSVHEDVTERVELEERLLRITNEKLRLLQSEADSARTIQQRLYPSTSPTLPGFDIAGRTVTATALCGDYLDFIPLPDGRLATVVGDVCGHGIGPALVMAETRAWMRAMLSTDAPLDHVFASVNQQISPDLPRSMFVTLFVSIIDPASDMIVAGGAGHAAIIVRADGQLESLPSTGLIFGMFDDTKYLPPIETLFRPGDTLLLMTDGLTEARSPDQEMFGLDRVVEIVEASVSFSSAELVDRLHETVLNHAATPAPEDDVTILAVKRTSPAR